jgi:hypothetical protein
VKIEKWLLVLAPAAGLATVALGLRLGAPSTQRAAIVYAAAAPLHDHVRALSIEVFRDQGGVREPVAGLPVDVEADAIDRAAHGRGCRGTTNDDGVIECVVNVGVPPFLREVAVYEPDRARYGEYLASGTPVERHAEVLSPPAPWLPFVRREGEVEIDAVLVGERAAPGFPATIWVRALDRDTRRALAGASVEFEGDASLTPAVAKGTTDARGWASIGVTPLGLAVTVTLRARARRAMPADGPEILGEWVGPFPMAPGAARVDTHPRWSPDEPIEIALTEPIAWRNAYVEIDDARGRAWATTVSGGAARGDGTTVTGLHPPALAPGLYWAIASASPFGATEGEGRTAYRAFFVAASDEAALALGTSPEACAAPSDVRDAARALGPCLALSARPAIERWEALDGFDALSGVDRGRRRIGLRIALFGLLAAALLEATLLLQGAARACVRWAIDGGAPVPAGRNAVSRLWTVAVTMLVALLGFALIAAVLFRVS